MKKYKLISNSLEAADKICGGKIIYTYDIEMDNAVCIKLDNGYVLFAGLYDYDDEELLQFSDEMIELGIWDKSDIKKTKAKIDRERREKDRATFNALKQRYGWK